MALKSKSIFLLGFLLLGIFGYYAFKPSVAYLRPILPPEQSFISQTVSFNGKKLAIRVPGSEHMVPRSDSDFILAFWIKFTRPPEMGKRYSLIQKIESKGDYFSGYAFELTRDAAGIRPVISWYADSKSPSSVFRFSDLKFSPKTWNLFIVGVKKGRYLLARMLSIRDNKPLEIQNLGAHDLGEFKDLSSPTELYFGSLRAGLLAGDFGPLLVLTGENMIDQLEAVIPLLVESPDQAPKLGDLGKVKLRVVPSADDALSQTANKVFKSE